MGGHSLSEKPKLLQSQTAGFMMPCGFNGGDQANMARRIVAAPLAAYRI
jgi:hypothetical protein